MVSPRSLIHPGSARALAAAVLLAPAARLHAQATIRTALDTTALTFTSDPPSAAWGFVNGMAASDGVDALQFPVPPAGQYQTVLQTTVTGPGRLTWMWKGDRIGFGGSRVPSQSPTAPPFWMEGEAIIPAGAATVQWYGSGASALLDKVVWAPASYATTMANALDTTGLTWTVSPANGWLPHTIPGTTVDYAAPAPQLFSVFAALKLSTTVTGPGLLTFDWVKPASDGTLYFQVGAAGAVEPRGYFAPVPSPAVVVLPPGTSTLTWTYYGAADYGARLDKVAVAPLPVITPAEATETPGRTWRTEPANPWIGGPALPGTADTDDALYVPVRTDAASAFGSSVDMDVTGFGKIDFELTRDYLLQEGENPLEVLVDGARQYLPSSQWPSVFVQGPGTHTIRWIHRPTAKLLPPLGLKKVTFTPVEAPTLAQALNPALTFTTPFAETDAVPWQGTKLGALDGTGSAFCNEPTSDPRSLETQVTGPSLISFQWLLAAPGRTPGNSYNAYLKFQVDGVTIAYAAPEFDLLRREPATITVAISPGTHTLRWVYAGDHQPQPNGGAWVDGVTVTPSTMTDAAFASGPASLFQLFQLSGDVTVAPGSETLDGQEALRLTASPAHGAILDAIGPAQGVGLIRLRYKSLSGSPALFAALQVQPSNPFASGAWYDLSSVRRTSGESWQELVLEAPPPAEPALRWKLHLEARTPDNVPQTVLVDTVTYESAGPTALLADAVDFNFGPTVYVEPGQQPRTINSYWDGGGNRWYGVKNGARDGTDTAMSIVLDGNPAELLYSEIPGAGTLTFWARHEGSGRLRLICGQDIIPRLDTGSEWKEYRVELGPGSRYIYIINEGGTGNGYSHAWVDQIQWTPTPAASVLSAPAVTGGTASVTWTETKWQPVRWAGLGAADSQALITTTADYAGTRPLRATVTGPGLLRWRWRWTDHTEPPVSSSIRSFGAVSVVIAGGFYPNQNPTAYIPPRAPALFCLLDNVRSRGLGTAGSLVDTSAWNEASLLIPAGEHAVNWELLTEAAPPLPPNSPFPPAANGISGLLDTVSFQTLPAPYLTWATSKFSAPAGDVSTLPYAPTDDPDSDGMPNAIEFAAGTSPTDAASRPVLHLEKSPAAAPVISLPVSLTAGYRFAVESSLDLQTWQPALINDLSPTTPGHFTAEILSVSNTARSAFVRITAVPQ